LLATAYSQTVDRSCLPSVGINDQRPGGSADYHRSRSPYGRHATITVGYTPSASKILRIFPADRRIAARPLAIIQQKHPSMKKLKDILLIVFALMITLDVFSQKNTLLTYEIGVTQKEFNFVSPQGLVEFYNSRNGVPGLIATQQIYNSLYLETGIYNDFLGCDMTAANELDTTNLLLAQDEIHIPLRIQFRQEYLNGRVNLFLSAGPMFVFGLGDYTYSLHSAQNNTELNTNKFDFKKNYTLFEFGIGTDIYLSKNFFVGLRYRYNHGFNEIIDINSNTQHISESNSMDYYLNSKGNYHAFMFSLGYRISKFWNKQ